MHIISKLCQFTHQTLKSGTFRSMNLRYNQSSDTTNTTAANKNNIPDAITTTTTTNNNNVGCCTAVLAGGGDEHRRDDDHRGNKKRKSRLIYATTLLTPRKIRDASQSKSVLYLHAWCHYLLCGVLPSGVHCPHNGSCQATEQEHTHTHTNIYVHGLPLTLREIEMNRI